MGKVKLGLYFYLTIGISTKVLGLGSKGKVHLILPVTKDRLSSLLEAQNDINFGHVKTCVKP